MIISNKIKKSTKGGLNFSGDDDVMLIVSSSANNNYSFTGLESFSKLTK